MVERIGLLTNRTNWAKIQRDRVVSSYWEGIKMEENYNQNYNQGDQPKKGAATASMVLGIIGVVFWFFGYGALVSVVLGIIGLVLAGSAKKAGNVSGVRTAGFVLSLISLIGGAIFFVACVACAGAIGAIGAIGSTSGY